MLEFKFSVARGSCKIRHRSQSPFHSLARFHRFTALLQHYPSLLFFKMRSMRVITCVSPLLIWVLLTNYSQPSYSSSSPSSPHSSHHPSGGYPLLSKPIESPTHTLFFARQSYRCHHIRVYPFHPLRILIPLSHYQICPLLPSRHWWYLRGDV